MDLALRLHRVGTVGVLAVVTFLVLMFAHPAGSLLGILGLFVAGMFLACGFVIYLFRSYKNRTLLKRRNPILAIAVIYPILLLVSFLTDPEQHTILYLIVVLLLLVPGIGALLWSVSLILIAWNGGSLSRKRILSVIIVLVFFVFYLLYDQFASDNPALDPWSLLLFFSCLAASVVTVKNEWGSHVRRMIAVSSLCGVAAIGLWWNVWKSMIMEYAALIHPAGLGFLLITASPVMVSFFLYPALRSAGTPHGPAPRQDGQQEGVGEETEAGEAGA